MYDGSINEEEHFAKVIERYSDMVYKLALARTKDKQNAEDVYQDVFMKYIKHYQSISSEEHAKAWLIRVTINCSNSLFSSAWYKRTVPLENEAVYMTPEKSELYYAVMDLPQKYRTAIHLFYYEGMSIREISEALSAKENTVKSWLKRGKELLKQNLKGAMF